MARCDVFYFDPTQAHRDPAGRPLRLPTDGWRPCTAPGRSGSTRPGAALGAPATAASLPPSTSPAWPTGPLATPRPPHLPSILQGGDVLSRAQRILAVIVGLITGVLLMESYGAMVTAARAGDRAIPSCGCRGCCWSPRSPSRPCFR